MGDRREEHDSLTSLHRAMTGECFVQDQQGDTETSGQPSCPSAHDDEAECPRCKQAMRLWAGYYRCPNCGYKESCCF